MDKEKISVVFIILGMILGVSGFLLLIEPLMLGGKINFDPSISFALFIIGLAILTITYGIEDSWGMYDNPG